MQTIYIGYATINGSHFRWFRSQKKKLTRRPAFPYIGYVSLITAR